MISINFPVVLLSALVPLLLGFIWYHPKFLGTVWMKETGVNPGPDDKKRMPRVMLLLAFCSLVIAFILQFIVVHQFHFYSMLANSPELTIEGSEVNIFYKQIMDRYGMEFRTFKHGAFHGSFTGLLLAIPIITFSSLFERRSWKYIAIHGGYWVVCLGIMGGLISAFP
jgi:hypothetical protein